MRLSRLPLLIGALALSLGAIGCSEQRTTQGNGGGTGGTGGGGGSPFGETTVYDLQDPAKQPASGTEVVLKGVVVTAVIERRQADGNYAAQQFFVQDPKGGKFSGIYVRNGADGDPVVTTPAVGDVVDLAGTYAEYFERSQIEVLSLENKGPGTLPAPITVDPEAIATGSAEMEAYEGVLVEVVEVVTTDAKPLDPKGQDFGYFRVNSQGKTEGGVIVGNLGRHGYVRVPADLFLSIVGVVDYAFEEAKLEPRGATDITFMDGSHPGLSEGGEKTVYQLQNPVADGHPRPPANVTVKDVVVTANGGNRIWVQETEGGPFSGIQVRLPSGVEAPEVGSLVTVTGQYTEYFDAAQIDQAAVEVTGTAAVPAPVAVTPAAIRTGSADAEQWEGVLVEVKDVKNVQDPVNGSDGTDRGDFRVAPIAGGTVENGVVVGHAFDNDYAGAVGDTFRSIVGVLDYTFSEFALQPRGNEDITFADGTHPAVPHKGVVSIYQLQDTSAAGYAGTDIGATVENVVVTASASSGFFVQERTGEARFSGLYVRIPNGAGLAAPVVGDVVTIDGKVFEYFSKTQMQVTSIEVTGTGTLPAPAVVDAVRVATGGADQEAFEGVLVQVNDVANVQDPVVGTDGSDRGDFRVGPKGGTAGVVVGHIWRTNYQGSVGDEFRSVVGVMDFSFDDAKIEPRGSSDITFKDGSHPAASSMTIAQVQNPNASGHPAVNTAVKLEGAVVTAASSRGFWIQDGTAQWSGIYVFRPNGNTQTLPAPGKRVNVEGVYVEYNGLSEIELTSVTEVGDAAIPAPVLLTPNQLTGEVAEPYEGMLVEVRDVENTQDPVLGTDGRDRGDFRVQAAGGTGGAVVGRTIGHDYDGAVGDGFDSIVGVLDYSFDEFRIQPRGNTDITLDDGTHPGSAGPTIVTIYDVQDPTAAAHPAEGTVVELQDVVVTAVRTNASGQLTGIYVSEPEGGAYSGIYAFKVASSVFPAGLAAGDVVTVVGAYDEYLSSSAPQGSRELSEIIVEEVRLVSAGTGTVEVIELDAADVAASSVDAEAYENCLVTVRNVTVNDAGTSFFKAQTTVDTDLSDEIYIGKILYPGLSLSLNQQLSSVTGVVDDFNGTYRLHPRGASDLVSP